MEEVRSATDGDLDRLVQLTAEFRASSGDRRGAGTTHAADPGGRMPAATEVEVSRYLSDPVRTALVASLDDWVAGMALCRVEETDGQRRGVLDSCFVEAGAREVGLGRLLLDAAVGWFRELGCAGVDGSALPGDRQAKQFYEGAGFKARLLVMHLPLD